MAINELDFVRQDIKAILGIDKKPSWGSSLKYFFKRVGQAASLTFAEEREIIPFILLQWLTIALGYYLWVQMLHWIPTGVWQSTENSNSGSVADIVLLAWSFVVVGIVALPLEILSAAMVATHFLKKTGQCPTFISSLQLVLPRIWSLWVFGWTDDWITVSQIIARIPSKQKTDSALKEALYYAWKLGTIGILPAITTGRGVIEAGKESVLLVKSKFLDTTLLRTGYSLVCWVVGVGAYIGTIIFFIFFAPPLPQSEFASYVYDFYILAGVPIVIAVGIVLLFIRPIYVIASSDIYAEYLQENQQPLLLTVPTSTTKLISILIVFLILITGIASVFLFRDQLGISAMLATPYKTVHSENQNNSDKSATSASVTTVTYADIQAGIAMNLKGQLQKATAAEESAPAELLFQEYGTYAFPAFQKHPELVGALQKLNPNFVANDVGTSDLSWIATFNGRTLLLLNGCYPHNCGGTSQVVALEPATGKVYLLQPVNVGPTSTDSGTYHLYGNPDKDVRAVIYTVYANETQNNTDRQDFTAVPNGTNTYSIHFSTCESSQYQVYFGDGYEGLQSGITSSDGSCHAGGVGVSHTYVTAGTYSAVLVDSTSLEIVAQLNITVPDSGNSTWSVSPHGFEQHSTSQ